MPEEFATWTSADISPASYSVYGRQYNNDFGPDNLKTLDGMWISAATDGARGVLVTFENEVMIKRFSGPYLNFLRPTNLTLNNLK